MTKIGWFLFSAVMITCIWNLVSPARTLTVNYYHEESLGRDIHAYAVVPWYDIQQGKTPRIFGYGAVLIAGVAIRFFELAGMCAEPVTCGNLVYFFMIFSCIGTLFFLTGKIVIEKGKRHLAYFLFITFLFGVPMYRAIEAGNPDLFLAPLFGIILYIIRKMQRTRTQSILLSILLGVLLGLFLNVKAFLALFVILTLIFSGKNIALWISFAISFALSGVWARLWGVPAGLFDVFVFALHEDFAVNAWMYTQVNYGNNAIFPYVSNVLQAFDIGKVPVPVHTILTNIIGMGLFLFIFVKPWVDEKRYLPFNKQSFRSFPFMLLLYTISYVIMLTLTAWSYDYRILYVLPLLFFFIDEANDPKTKRLLMISIVFLVLKCLWIPKDRIMTVFLYAHIYYLTRTAISLWRIRTRNIV